VFLPSVALQQQLWRWPRLLLTLSSRASPPLLPLVSSRRRAAAALLFLQQSLPTLHLHCIQTLVAQTKFCLEEGTSSSSSSSSGQGFGGPELCQPQLMCRRPLRRRPSSRTKVRMYRVGFGFGLFKKFVFHRFGFRIQQ
jgi:hypothetical protein